MSAALPSVPLDRMVLVGCAAHDPSRTDVDPRRRARRVCASAAACAAATILGLRFLLNEFAFHFAPAGRLLACTAVACGIGVLLGLWLPARVVRRRIRAEQRGGFPLDPRDVVATPVDLEFAARVVAGILFAAGIVWVLACGSAHFLEDLRRALAVRFILPTTARAAIVGIAALGMLAVATAAATIALVALHGWFRAVTAPKTDLIRLWRVLLLAVGLGAVLDMIPAPPLLRLLAAPAGFFAAGLLASHPARGLAPAASPSTARPDTRFPARGAALGVTVVAFLVGDTLLDRIELTGADRTDAVRIACLATGCWLGVSVGRAALQRGAGQPTILLALAIALIAWLAPRFFPHAQTEATTVARLLLAGTAGSAAVVALGRRAARELGGVQTALVALGGAVTLGLTAAGLHSGLTTSFVQPVAGVTAIQSPAAATLAAATRDAVRLLSFAPGDALLHALRSPPEPLAPPSAWKLDLGGPRYDLLWVALAPGSEDGVPPDGADLSRALRRCASALLRRGRLVLVLPDFDARSERRAAALLSDAERARARIVYLQHNGERLTLLVLGGGIEAWWSAVPLPAGMTATLAPVPSGSEAGALHAQ